MPTIILYMTSKPKKEWGVMHQRPAGSSFELHHEEFSGIEKLIEYLVRERSAGRIIDIRGEHKAIVFKSDVPLSVCWNYGKEGFENPNGYRPISIDGLRNVEYLVHNRLYNQA